MSHLRASWTRLASRSAAFIGNSFGGALTLALAARHPEKVDKIVLMGAAGLPFPITDGLAKVWGYQPSAAAMRDLMETFAFNPGLVTDVIVESRYQASIRPGAQEAFYPNRVRRGSMRSALRKTSFVRSPSRHWSSMAVKM